jgi:hypothetical protein
MPYRHLQKARAVPCPQTGNPTNIKRIEYFIIVSKYIFVI